MKYQIYLCIYRKKMSKIISEIRLKNKKNTIIESFLKKNPYM